MQAFELTDDNMQCSGGKISPAPHGMAVLLRHQQFWLHRLQLSLAAGEMHFAPTGCNGMQMMQEKAYPERVLYTAHVGDARAVLCRSGLAVRLTGESDHKATDAEEAKRVVEAQQWFR